MKKSFPVITSIALLLNISQIYATPLQPGHFLFEAGAFSSTQGKTQDILIEDLIGDRFYVTKRHDSNALFGLGYQVNGFKNKSFGVDFGLNIYYLAKTKVRGTIEQEFYYTNLAYQYEVNHVPLYATAKAHIPIKSSPLALTLNAGIGPNFLKTSRYNDWSIDDGVTLPDHAFSGRSDVTLSAMAGIGLQFNGKVPLECGYRFFYLGEGNFNARTNQILNTLKTGNIYAQALVCSLTA